MKKLLLFCSIAALSWTCSTEVDLLDDWKETTVVYCLLDQSQGTQYIRIQKAFLGPDNALNMAQQYDSINYVNQLNVVVNELDGNNNIVTSFTCQPDTFPKDGGMFAGPDQVVYSFDTPQGTLNSSHNYQVVVKNTATGNTVKAVTNLVESSTTTVFNMVTPSASNASVSFAPTTTQPNFTMKWNAAPSAYIYQPTITFYYTEYYTNGDSAWKQTPTWTLAVVEPANSALTSPQSLEFDKMDFFRFLGNNIADDPNVVKRRSRYVQFQVFAGNYELKNYIDINGASNSISQEHPQYTNVFNDDPNIPAFGIVASRYQAQKMPGYGVYTWPLGTTTIDGLASSNFLGLVSNQYTCHLKFMKTDGTVPGCP